MYLYAYDIEDCKDSMQRDQVEIANWCRSNELSLNIKKTKCMLFGSRVRLKNTRCPSYT